MGTAAPGAAAMVLFTVLARLASEVDHGRLLDWLRPSYEIGQVRLLGLDVYVDTSLSPGDVLVGLALLGVAGVATVVALRLRRVGAARHAGSFGLIAVGAAYLAIDEMLAVHETVGYNLPALRHLPGVQHPGDLILVASLVVALVVLWDRRDMLDAAPRGRRLLAGAVVLATGAFACDLWFEQAGYIEERLEILAGGAMLLGFVDLAVEHLRSAPTVREPGASTRMRQREWSSGG